MKLIYILIFNALILTTACNKGTNPAESYSDVPSVPKNDQPQPQQEYGGTTLSIKSEPELSLPTFNETIEGHAQFLVGHDSRVTEHTLEVLEGPDGGKLTKNPRKADTWDYYWTPPQRFISEGFVRVAKLILLAKATKVTEPRLATASSPTSFDLTVVRGNNPPQITETPDLSDDLENITVIQAGEIRSFTVIVEDKLASEARLSVEAKSCGQVHRIARPQYDGNIYVSQAGVKDLRNGRFEVQMKIDLESKPLPVNRQETSQNSGEGIDLCLDLQAFNKDTNLGSVAKRRVVGALYRPKTPVITLDDRLKIVRAGRVAAVDFAVDAGVEYGDLVVTANTDSFPGEKRFECVPFKMKEKEIPNRLNCSFQWMVPDDEKTLAQTYRLFVISRHTVVRNGRPLTLTGETATTFRIDKIEKVKK